MLDREAEDIEAGRLFYVAATRAHELGLAGSDQSSDPKHLAAAELERRIDRGFE